MMWFEQEAKKLQKIVERVVRQHIGPKRLIWLVAMVLAFFAIRQVPWTTASAIVVKLWDHRLKKSIETIELTATAKFGDEVFQPDDAHSTGSYYLEQTVKIQYPSCILSVKKHEALKLGPRGEHVSYDLTSDARLMLGNLRKVEVSAGINASIPHNMVWSRKDNRVKNAYLFDGDTTNYAVQTEYWGKEFETTYDRGHPEVLHSSSLVFQFLSDSSDESLSDAIVYLDRKCGNSQAVPVDRVH
jgi:hypothetical protein